MKRTLFLLLNILAIAGCEGLAVGTFTVKPISNDEVLEAEATTLMLANQEGEQGTDTDSAVKCLCGGTGRSGDGLGPCACPDGCTCKKTKLEYPVTEPVPQTTVDELDMIDHRVDELKTRVAELTAIHQEVVDKIDNELTRVEAIEDRLAKLESVESNDTFKNDSLPARKLIVMTRMDGTCAPCKTFEVVEVPKLISAGWTVGDNDSYQIILVDVAGELAKEWPDALSNAQNEGTPYFAFYDGDRLASGHVGYTSAVKLAEELNLLIKSPVVPMKNEQANCDCPKCNRSAIVSYRQMVYAPLKPVPDHNGLTQFIARNRFVTQRAWYFNYGN